ncbi:MAG: hypothetical protein IJW44_00050 [Clostridia bacterium]|nr:hypothetical protein [Clostridia bacterium]
MKHTKWMLRAVSTLCALLLLTASLASCGKKDTVKATEVVGTVDGKEVCYDELYYLVNGYAETVRAKHGEDTEAIRAELDQLFRENVLGTYAILRLCENHGLTYDENEWKDEINSSIDADIENTAAGDEDAYYADLEESGKTRRLLRFYFGVDVLYTQLMTVYPQKGLVVGSEEELTRIFREQFAHVYHLAVFEDGYSTPNATPEKLAEAREALATGQTTMYQLIKNGYTEDISDTAADGWHVVRGSADPVYEEAAFALMIGGVSPVIQSKGENNAGAYVDCYYVIQRFEMDDAYINNHFDELQEDYYGTVIAADLEEVEATLSFTSNEFYNSLDLANLQKPHESSGGWWIALAVTGGVILVAAAVILPVVILKRKHRKKNLAVIQKKAGGAHETK